METQEKANRYISNYSLSSIIESYMSDKTPFIKSDSVRFSKAEIEPRIIYEIKRALFPNYFDEALGSFPLEHEALLRINKLGELLLKNNWRAYLYEHPEPEIPWQDIEARSRDAVTLLLDKLGEIREKLKLDVD